MEPVLWWIRRDARLADNGALHAAVKSGRPVIPVYIHAPGEEAPWEPGAAARWWWHHALAALDKQLGTKGSRVIIRRGPTAETLETLLKETGAAGVYWNRLYEPAIVARDTRIKASLKKLGYTAESFAGALLHEPPRISNKAGKPFQVFTPFWNHISSLDDPPEPLPAPTRIPAPAAWPDSLPLDALRLLPTIGWDAGFHRIWTPGEVGSTAALDRFLSHAVNVYQTERDRPDLESVSCLSPYLHHGEVTPRQCWHAVKEAAGAKGSAGSWLRQLGWRDFSHHLLFHFPHTAEEPLRPEFKAFPWREAGTDLRVWQRGQTGYPIVDAGMRQLWTTGWMHNRVRMIVASFLVKHLCIHWIEGARWFWDTLVDANLANNTMGWQWTAGCGADAAPYFRIFNPITQGEKFDETGTYTRRWVPEIALLPNATLWKPWEAASDAFARKSGAGGDYPAPLVEHTVGRERALEAYAVVKKSKAV